MELWFEPSQFGFRICARHILPFEFLNRGIKEKKATYFGFGGDFPSESRGIQCSPWHHCKDWERAAPAGLWRLNEPTVKQDFGSTEGWGMCYAEQTWAGTYMPSGEVEAKTLFDADLMPVNYPWLARRKPESSALFVRRIFLKAVTLNGGYLPFMWLKSLYFAFKS